MTPESLLPTLVERFGVTEEVAEDCLAQAAPTKYGLIMLAKSCSQELDEFTSGEVDLKPAQIRLASALRSHGVVDVRLPRCVECDQEKRLPYQSDHGRVCGACYQRLNVAKCVICGITRPIGSRTETGQPKCVVCSVVLVPCTGCNKSRKVAFRSDTGEPYCQTCRPITKQVCTRCGNERKVQRRTSDGPVCPNCYIKFEQRHRTCGLCARDARIMVTADGESPDVCVSCYAKPLLRCAECDERIDCGHDLPADAGLEPQGADFTNDRKRLLTKIRAAPRSVKTCVGCDRERPPQAIWPIGPVCSSCYTAILDAPGQCTACGLHGVLIGSANGKPICARCSGASSHYECRTCSTPGRLYEQGRCVGCVLESRLSEVLGQGGSAGSKQLNSLRIALLSESNQRETLRWMSSSASTSILADLSKQDDLIEHHTLDRYEPVKAVYYLRDLLVETGVLEPRPEHLERLSNWIDERLSTVPAEHSVFVSPFAHWYLLRRARRRQDAGRFTAGSARYLKQRVNAALHLLEWLADHDRELSEVRQADIDLYLATGSTRRYIARDFLRWAAKNGNAPKLVLPIRTVRTATPAFDDDARWGQVRTMFTDDAVDLDVRVAGAILLLYGIHISRIVAIKTENIEVTDGGTTIMFGSHSVDLPQPLAQHVRALVESQRGRSRRRSAGDSPWLFPGLTPGKHINDEHMRVKLAEHGIVGRNAHNTALAELAAEVPAPILASMLGIHINTSVGWVKSMKTDWTGYVEEVLAARTP